MKTFILGPCLFLLTVYIKTSSSEILRIKRSFTGDDSTETYNMYITEQGSHVKEKITFDKIKETASFHVPGHRDISEADVLIDYKSNVTITRLPGNHVCYVRPRSHFEPSMDRMRKSMGKVSTGKYKIRESEKLNSAEWIPKKVDDVSKLSEIVIKYCGGFSIYYLEKVEQDGVTLSQGVSRTKRQSTLAFPFCKDVLTGYTHLSRDCPRANYVTTCKFASRSCVYWVTCDGGIRSKGLRDGICDSDHQTVNAFCCDLKCP